MDPLTIAILGIGGFLLSTISEISNGFAKQDEYDFNKGQLEEAKKDKLDEIDLSHKQNIEAKDLEWKVTLDAASQDYNNQIDSLQNETANDAFQWNLEAIASGQQTGTSLSTLAGSGVRAGSSVAQAIELQAGLNGAQLQAEQDTRRNQIGLGLKQMGQNVAAFNGGNNYLQYITGINQANDAYTLTRKNTVNTYQRQFDQLKYDYDDYMSSSSRAKRFFGGLFDFTGNLASIYNSYSSTHPQIKK